MTKIVWQIGNNRTATYYQNIILSVSYEYGRRGYLDNYAGQSISITIKNQANESANFQLNDWIDLLGDLGPYRAYYQSFWVTAIDYQDYPGNTGLSTATITASDAMHRLGRVLGKGDTLSAGTTGSQVESMDTKSSWPPDITTFSFETNSLYCIHLLHDLLFVGKEAIHDDFHHHKINTPGTIESKNWNYRFNFTIEDLEKNKELSSELKAMIVKSKRIQLT